MKIVNSVLICSGFKLMVLAIFMTMAGTGNVVWSQSEEAEIVSVPNIMQMDNLQEALSSKISARSILRETLESAAEDDVPNLQKALEELNNEISEIRESFEQLAVGSVDIDLFNNEEVTLDWRNEVIQILTPLMQNVKRITEKPRKIEQLRSKISLAENQKEVTVAALLSIQQSLDDATVSAETIDPETRIALDDLRKQWIERQQDIDREINSSTIQLANIQSNNESLWVRSRDGLFSFITGRGLTLVLAGLAGAVVWYGTKTVTEFFAKRAQGEDVNSFRTRQRIVHYALKAFTLLLILIVVMVVFYLRGDLLLMGVTFLIAAAAILGLRHTVPQFIAESKLLLNLGPIREGERVMYKGLPWKVIKLHVYSILKNPELTGIIRLPLQDMLGLVSRPAGEEPWFPASKNDYLLLDNGNMLKVVSLTPEQVHLENLSGTKTTMSATEFYNMTFENITRSESFFISNVFGIGYAHQSDSVVEIPNKLKKAVSEALATSDIAEDVESVFVELQEAGASSLDYWLGVKLKSNAATSYFGVRRLLQQVCVATCTKENWDIPFPQLTLHQN